MYSVYTTTPSHHSLSTPVSASEEAKPGTISHVMDANVTMSCNAHRIPRYCRETGTTQEWTDYHPGGHTELP